MNKRKHLEDEQDPSTDINVSGGESQIATGEHGRNVKADMYIEKQIISRETPSQTESEKLQSALYLLATMPLDRIPAPASMPAGSRPPKIPPNRLFVGREADLKQLAAWLKGENAVAIGQVAAATGMGGIGKTQLAAEFAHRYGQYFAGGVYWLSFADPDLVPSEIAACCDAEDNRPQEEKVKQVLAEWQNSYPRLVVFDNCEDAKLLVKWRPPTGGTRVLVTSRQGKWDPGLCVELLPLGVLSRDESVALLRGFRGDLQKADADLHAIAAELGDLPLALHMAGSYLKTYEHDVAPKQYLQALKKPELLRHPSLSKGEFAPVGHDLAVGRTFALSVERLNKENKTDQLAQCLLKLGACFAPGEWIERGLLKDAWEEDEESAFGDGVKRLVGLGLVEENREGALRMHRLVAYFVREALPDKDALVKVEVVVLNAANAADDSGLPARMQPVIAHLKYLTDRALPCKNERAGELANELGSYLHVIADYAGARPYYEQALAIRRKVLGEEHPDTAESLNNLGVLLKTMGDYISSRPYYEQALVIRRKVLGEEHPDTAESLNNLGVLLKTTGDYAGARPYYEQALAIRSKVLGEKHPDTANSLNNLGGLLDSMGEYVGARLYLEQALAIRKKVLGEEHPDTALSLNNLGMLLQNTGDYAGARPYLEQALAIKRKARGEEHPSTAISLNNLGMLLQDMGDYAGARPYYEQSLVIFEKALGKDHPNTRKVRGNLERLKK